MKIGYARVSTRDQKLDIQAEALRKEGCERIFMEKKSGTLRHREALDECLSFIREGDVLVVYKLDRIGRSLKDIISILEHLKRKGVRFVSLQDSISTEGIAGELMTNILAAFAQFERDIIVERCQTGRMAAAAGGKKMGRPAGRPNGRNRGKAESCAALYQSGMTVAGIRKVLGIGSNETVYRYLAACGISPRRRRTGG